MWVHVQLDSPNDGIGADWSKAGDLEFYGAENRAGNVSSGAAGFFGEQTRRTSGAYTCAFIEPAFKIRDKTERWGCGDDSTAACAASRGVV